MNKGELCLQLRELFKDENELIGEIYFVLKDQDSLILRLADIDSDDQKELTNQFITRIKTDIIENEELRVMMISKADERKNVLYEYDLDNKPDDLFIFDLLKTNEEFLNFNYKKNNFSEIKGFLILISNNNNTLIVYKHHYSIACIKKDSSFNLIKLGNKERLVKLDSDILKISSNYDFFELNGSLMINNMKTLESNFKFHDVVIKNAKESIKFIEDINLIENPKELESMLKNISYARKLVKVGKTSPVLGKVSNENIIRFINNFPTLQEKLELNETGDKISLRTVKSKELLIKVLNDDYLQSQLTNYFYDSLAKDAIEEYKIG